MARDEEEDFDDEMDENEEDEEEEDEVPDKHIYCVEGHWDWGTVVLEPTVVPILDMVAQLGEWDYIRRNCATVSEMNFFLEREWCELPQGSVLYLATHGEPGFICLSDDERLGLETLGDRLWGLDCDDKKVHHCEGCLVHFGGCKVLSVKEDRIRSFIKQTGASAVSGFRKDVGWTNPKHHPAATALELMLFSAISPENFSLEDGRGANRNLKNISKDLQKRFPECGFVMYTKWD